MEAFSYKGFHAYHVVVVTAGRKPVLTHAFASRLSDQIRRSAQATSFELIAFVIMPDHVHMLCEGLTEDAHLPRFVQRMKQVAGYEYKREHREALWQHRFFDHVVRREEDLLSIANYIHGNPVRAGLVATIEEWPHSGGTAMHGAKLRPADVTDCVCS